MILVKAGGWALGVGLFAGCASTGGADRSIGDAPPPTTNQALTVENALRWPLDGQGGADRLIAAVRQTMPVRELANPGQYASRGPAQLADGYTLTFADFTPAHSIISIGVAREPCYPTERAAALLGATASPVTRDQHGVDIGQSFTTVRNGMSVNFTTTPAPYRCIDGIHVGKEAQR